MQLTPALLPSKSKESGRLKSMWSQRVWHDLAAKQQQHSFLIIHCIIGQHTWMQLAQYQTPGEDHKYFSECMVEVFLFKIVPLE